MPILVQGTGGETVIKTGRSISFGKKQIPLNLVFGAKKDGWGQVTGLGVQMGTSSALRDPKQLIRMDFHTPDVGHGSNNNGLKADEINVLYDSARKFHYHVRKWNGDK